MKTNTLLLCLCLMAASILPAQAVASISHYRETNGDTRVKEMLTTPGDMFSFGWTYLPDTNLDDYNGQVDGNFLDQQLGSSIQINIPLILFRKNIVKSGILSAETGLSLNVSNIVFSKSMALTKDTNGRLWPQYTSADDKFKKSKLCLTYLDFPFRIGLTHGEKKHQNFDAALGIVPGILLNEHTKVKNPKEKDRLHCVNHFRLNTELRIGILNNYYIYTSYDLMPLFKSEAGPDTHAAAFGIGLFM